MVACEFLVPCGLTTDTLHFCFAFFFPSHFVFYVIFFPPCGGVHPLFFTCSSFFSHILRNTLIILISLPPFPSFPPSPLPWIPVHLLVDSLIEVASVAPGVCSRLPFCVQYIRHAEPIR